VHLIVAPAIDKGKIQISIEGQRLSDELVQKADQIVEVKDDAQKTVALNLMKTMKGFLNTVEGARTDIKKPFLEMGKLIDGLAKKLSEPVQTKFNSIQVLVSKYEFQLQQEAERIRREQEAEQRRVEAEAQAKLDAAEKEFAAKVNNLLAKRDAFPADSARWKAVDSQISMLYEHQGRTRESIAKVVEQRIEETQATIALSAPDKMKGQSNRNIPKVEIVDLHALYKARPELVDLSLKTTMVQALMREGVTELPGLKLSWEFQVSVR